MIELGAAILGALSVMLLVSALSGQLTLTRRRALNRAMRLEAQRFRPAEPTAAAAPGGEARASLLRNQSLSGNKALNSFLHRFSWSLTRAQTLERADLPLKVGEYAMILAFLGLSLAVLVTLITGFIIAGLVVGAVAVLVVEWWVVRRTKIRTDKFNEQLPTALQMMAVSLQSGFSISDAIRTVANDMDPPLSEEFGRIMDEARAGGSFEDSLHRLEERIESPDLHIAIQALTVHARVGGNLGEILDQVAATMREREKLRREVRSMTAQERVSANIVALLPFWVLGFTFVVSKEAVAPLWETSTGHIIAAVAIAFEVVGLILTRRVTKVEV